MRYEMRMTLAYGAGLPTFVSRHYIVESAVRVQEVVSRFIEAVPEFGGA